MNKKLVVGVVVLVLSLGGFKYLRDNGLIMEIKKEEVIKVVNQFNEIIEKENEKEELEKSQPGIAEEVVRKSEEKIVGVVEDQEIVTEEGEYKEIVKQPKEEVRRLSKEEKYLRRNGITINKEMSPSYEYLKLCGKCHGYKATGYNNGKELIGPGIVHYSSTGLYELLMDYKQGILVGDVMTRTLKNEDPVKLRKISEEIQKFKTRR